MLLEVKHLTKRFGGFRPMVFMQHGIACAMWMTASAIEGEERRTSRPTAIDVGSNCST